ncbi:hypothetical protein ES703_120035 [subsurface metagenome]
MTRERHIAAQPGLPTFGPPLRKGQPRYQNRQQIECAIIDRHRAGASAQEIAHDLHSTAEIIDTILFSFGYASRVLSPGA